MQVPAGKFNRSGQDRWVFGDRTSGANLHKFAWTGIVRHQIVPRAATEIPLDTALQHPCPPTSHQGLLEPDARKRARPVLRGARRRKAPGLPD